MDGLWIGNFSCFCWKIWRGNYCSPLHGGIHAHHAHMIDMLHNAGKLSYDEIMTRQVLLGGQDLRTSTSKDPVKKEGYVRRALFLQHFYSYAKANPTMEKSWSEWVKEQGYASSFNQVK